MRYKLLCCKIIEREIARLSCDCKNQIDVTMIRQKLHDKPKKLQEILQEEIDQIEQGDHRYSNSVESGDYDAILLGYGLCAEAIVGLFSRKYPLVVPRAHDCVTFIMGGKETYMDYYMKNAGTFYYWPGAVELMGFAIEPRYDARYQWYLIRYKGNQKKARRAVEVEKTFLDTYKKSAYITWDNLKFPKYEEEVQKYAQNRGWEYEKLQGNDGLLRNFLNGDWYEDQFLVAPPGYQIQPSYDELIIKAEKCENDVLIRENNNTHL